MSFPFFRSARPTAPEAHEEPQPGPPEDSTKPKTKILWFGSAPAVPRPINTITKEHHDPRPIADPHV